VDPEFDPVRITPVLIHAPVFWLEHYWSESTHQWDGVGPITPLAARPYVEMEVGLEATLGDILDRACEALDILPGPDMARNRSTRRGEIVRFAFVEEEADSEGIDSGTVYSWPSRLRIPEVDGTISEVFGQDVTVRQLLAAGQLGLIHGDVTRPYLFPVIPQGSGQVVTDIATIAPEIVRAAMSAIRGLDGELIRVVSAFPKELRHADAYASTHPIEAASIATASGNLWKKFKKKRGGS